MLLKDLETLSFFDVSELNKFLHSWQFDDFDLTLQGTNWDSNFDENSLKFTMKKDNLQKWREKKSHLGMFWWHSPRAYLWNATFLFSNRELPVTFRIGTRNLKKKCKPRNNFLLFLFRNRKKWNGTWNNKHFLRFLEKFERIFGIVLLRWRYFAGCFVNLSKLWGKQAHEFWLM